MCSNWNPGERERESVWCVSDGGLIPAAERSPCDLPFLWNVPRAALTEIPEATRNPPCLSGELCLLGPSPTEKGWKLWSLGKEGGCGWGSESGAPWLRDDLGSPRQGLSPGRGLCLACRPDFRRLRRALPLQVDFPSSCWCNLSWLPARLQMARSDPFSLSVADRERSFDSSGWQIKKKKKKYSVSVYWRVKKQC